MGQARARGSDSRYEREARLYLHWYYHEALGLPPESAQRSADERLERTEAKGFAAALDRELDLAGTRMLDVGCGCGELLLEATELGADVHGVGPDGYEVAIANLLLSTHGHERRAVTARAEDLPFPDEFFDVVTCCDALGQVDDVEQAIAELLRVAKPGAGIVVSVPNALVPYEPHYRMPWVPLLPARLGKHVLRAAGRDPWFLLSRTRGMTYPQLMRLWRRHNLRIRHFAAEAVGRDHGHLHSSGRLRRLLPRPLQANLAFLLEKPARVGTLTHATGRREQPVGQEIQPIA